jgi:hypothetical protein
MPLDLESLTIQALHYVIIIYFEHYQRVYWMVVKAIASIALTTIHARM